MAATKTAKNRTSGNDTPNTPDVSESKIARMKVDELRRELKNRGVKGTEDLKKPELVSKLIKAEVKSGGTGKGRSGKSGNSKNPTSHNDTPNTPDVNESKIARMKVDELRRELKNRGVKGTEDLKKPDLVKKLIKAEQKSTGTKASARTTKASASTAKASTGSAKSTAKATSNNSVQAKSGSKNPTSHNDTPNTPDVDESKIARLKVSELRTRLARQGVEGTAELKKPELVKKLIKSLTGSGKGRSAAAGSTGKKSTAAGSTGKKSTASRSTAASSTAASSTASSSTASSSTGKKSGATSSAGKNSGKSSNSRSGESGGKRLGKKSSSSLQYSQEITSTADRPERAGRSLVTTDHEVIRQWAKARRAVPSTVAGTEHDGHLGVLRFDFPGYSGDRLVEVSWAEWFEAFDKRRLNFIYQERLASGDRSNFFQLENPDE